MEHQGRSGKPMCVTQRRIQSVLLIGTICLIGSPLQRGVAKKRVGDCQAHEWVRRCVRRCALPRSEMQMDYSNQEPIALFASIDDQKGRNAVILRLKMGLLSAL